MNIVFSLVEESQSLTDDELLEEISKALGKEGIVIPWVDELVDVSLTLSWKSNYDCYFYPDNLIKKGKNCVR